MSPTIAAVAPAREEAMPLPQWLLRIYYIFPIILYVPDVIFNYFVYSKGVSTPFNGYDITTYPENALWLFLALGIVGMAWLLSILAPWHWARDNKFQSLMCWFGVLIATGITTWNSLAYRMSQTNSPFPTDRWVADTFHITLAGFSPTTILVSISPPFWGLFWAIVQPSERRRSSHEEQQSHEARMLKIKLDAEMKAAKASASATVREAQLKGLAASMKAARSQIGAAVASQDAGHSEEIVEDALSEQETSESEARQPIAIDGHIGRGATLPFVENADQEFVSPQIVLDQQNTAAVVARRQPTGTFGTLVIQNRGKASRNARA